MPRALDGLPPFVIDLYVHAAPDLIERVDDDLALAVNLRDTGITAAVHRNHFTSTAERAHLVAAATGYPLLGALICSDVIGGLNPVAVDHALRMGAAWIGLPTLSAHHHRARTSAVPSPARAGVTFGPGQLRLTDVDGQLRSEVGDIVELARAAGVPVNVGYSSFAECRQLLVPHRFGSVTFVVTNPLTTPGWTLQELASAATGGLVVELTAFSLFIEQRRGASDRWLADARAIISTIGIDHVVLSSDSGIRGAPRSAELLAIACGQLASAGLTDDHLESLVGHTPARLIRWPRHVAD
jgi:Family of unknown function (DUF6282)